MPDDTEKRCEHRIVVGMELCIKSQVDREELVDCVRHALGNSTASVAINDALFNTFPDDETELEYWDIVGDRSKTKTKSKVDPRIDGDSEAAFLLYLRDRLVNLHFEEPDDPIIGRLESVAEMLEDLEEMQRGAE